MGPRWHGALAPIRRRLRWHALAYRRRGRALVSPNVFPHVFPKALPALGQAKIRSKIQNQFYPAILPGKIETKIQIRFYPANPMTKSKRNSSALKLVPFTEPLLADLDKLPLFGVHVRDCHAHAWNPSVGWHKGAAAKLGKKFSLRNVGQHLLIIRIK